MSEYQISKVATNILLDNQNDKRELLDYHKDDIKQKILEITYDCTPNWGINGAEMNAFKENWYLQEEKYQEHYKKQVQNLNIRELEKILDMALKDIFGRQVTIEGFGIYGSYLYGLESCPNDLDVIILVDGIEGITYDALKYPLTNGHKMFYNRNLNKNELGLTIISIDQLTSENLNYIVSDAALVDKATTYTKGKSIKCPPLPSFILNQNAQKLVKWGISSSIGNGVFVLEKRINEAILMRQYMISRMKPHEKSKFGKMEFGGIVDYNYSEKLLTLLQEDERMIRKMMTQSF